MEDLNCNLSHRRDIKTNKILLEFSRQSDSIQKVGNLIFWLYYKPYFPPQTTVKPSDNLEILLKSQMIEEAKNSGVVIVWVATKFPSTLLFHSWTAVNTVNND